MMLVIGVFFVLISSVATLVIDNNFQKSGRKPLSWLLIMLSTVATMLVGIFFIYVLVDFRSHKKILIDLRKSQSAISTDLKSACPTSGIEPSFCDSRNYILDAKIIFPDNAELFVTSDSIYWYEDDGKIISYISIMGKKSHTLQVGRALLFEHAAVFSDPYDQTTKKEIAAAAEWILKCCKNNVFYSENYSVQLRSQLGLNFRKNVDAISIDYSIKPGV